MSKNSEVAFALKSVLNELMSRVSVRGVNIKAVNT